MKRELARWMHRLAYWLDCQADNIWDVDDFTYPVDP